MRIRRLFLVFLLVLLAIPQSAEAQTNSSTAGVSLLSNPRIQATANPGDVVTGTLTVKNEGQNEDDVKVFIQDALPADTEGHAHFLTEADPPSPYPVAAWTTVTPMHKVLKSKETTEFSYKITVPKDASPGGHYGGIGFGVDPNSTSANSPTLSTSSRVYALIYLTVSGDIKYEANISLFNITHKDDLKVSAKSTQTKAGYESVTMVKNTGNVHFIPGDAKVVVTNMFGNEVAKFPMDPDTSKYVLPSSERRFSNNLFKDLKPGRYTAKVSFLYGPSSGPFETVSATTTFYVGPPLWVWIVVGSLLFLLLLMVLFRKRFKRAAKAFKG